LGVESGARIIRAHDVAETVQAVRMAEAVWQRRKE
jgi:dihydropteroate synthase